MAGSASQRRGGGARWPIAARGEGCRGRLREFRPRALLSGPPRSRCPCPRPSRCPCPGPVPVPVSVSLSGVAARWGRCRATRGSTWRSRTTLRASSTSSTRRRPSPRTGSRPTARETRTLAEIAKVELDNMPLRGKQLRVRFACHSASLTVRNLPQFVSNELLEEAFSVFGQVERAVVIVDDRGRSSGKGIVEFSGKPAARKALDRCSDGSFLLTTFPRPVTVEPMDQYDDEEGLPEKLVIKNQQYHKEREQPPRFAQPGSFEYEYAMRWKALIEMEKQQQEQVDRNIKEAREKLEMEMEAARHEHQVMLMRQDLMRRQEELRRMEELHNQEVQKRKQLELRQEEERRRREEEMRRQQEEMMRRQQEGFKGNFADAREPPDMRMGQMGMGGTIGMNNRGAMGGTNVPAPAPPAAGPGAMIPDGAMGMTPPPPPDRFGQGGAMEGLGAMGGNPPAFNRGNPGGDFGPNKRRRY